MTGPGPGPRGRARVARAARALALGLAATLAQLAGCASGADAALRATTCEVVEVPGLDEAGSAGVSSAALVLGLGAEETGAPAWLEARALERAVRAALPAELAATAGVAVVPGDDPTWWAPLGGNATAVAHRHEPGDARAEFAVELGARVRPWGGARRPDEPPTAAPRSAWRLELQSLARWPRSAWSSDNDRHLEAAQAAHEALVEQALRELERACEAAGYVAERRGASSVSLRPARD